MVYLNLALILLSGLIAVFSVWKTIQDFRRLRRCKTKRVNGSGDFCILGYKHSGPCEDLWTFVNHASFKAANVTSEPEPEDFIEQESI